MPIRFGRLLLMVSLTMASLPRSAAATWSIIVLDRKSQTVGVAGASCTSDVYGIASLVPGAGALVAQAIGYPPAVREAIRLLRGGVPVDSVLRAITSPALDSAVENRQYAMVTFTGGQIQYSGAALHAYQGVRTAEGVLVQGNLLTGSNVLDRTLEAVQRAQTAGLPMAEVLMAGLQAGAEAGGDSRCGAQRATAAFLTIAKPGDVPSWPYLTLRVVGVAQGSTVNAVTVLGERLRLWKANGGEKLRITSETVKPDSANFR